MPHTPGPWIWRKREGNFYIMSQKVRHPNANGNDWHDVAYLSVTNGCDANDAALIAAAPDLLAAAVAARSALDKLMGDSDLASDDTAEMRACKALSAAIAKSAAS